MVFFKSPPTKCCCCDCRRRRRRQLVRPSVRAMNFHGCANSPTRGRRTRARTVAFIITCLGRPLCVGVGVAAVVVVVVDVVPVAKCVECVFTFPSTRVCVCVCRRLDVVLAVGTTHPPPPRTPFPHLPPHHGYQTSQTRALAEAAGRM